MIPAANMLGFAGQELARKMPQKALAVVLETTFGSVVEIILFMTLLKTSVGDSNVLVIKAAILGSILANILLCLGSCFVAGGIKQSTQEFHPAVSENGSGLMIVASSTLSSLPPIRCRANSRSGSGSSSRLPQIPIQQSRLCCRCRHGRL